MSWALAVLRCRPARSIIRLGKVPSVTQQYNSTVDRQRFRLTTGIIWMLKHSGT